MTKKNRPLLWAFVNHAKKEYISGNYLIAGHPMPAGFMTINEILSSNSAVGAVLIALITPLCKKSTGEPVEVASNQIRGRWLGDHFEPINNKFNKEEFRRIEGDYVNLNVSSMYYMKETAKGWAKPLYETNKDFWVMDEPR
tara:strand:- start:117 stop:539 length:423 start_codon:yes stop_codon:yes gene_type:complete